MTPAVRRQLAGIAVSAMLLVFCSIPLAAQNDGISGPVLGFAADETGAAISPILGVFGASLIGEPLQIGVDIKKAVVSPEQNYALALRNDDGNVILIKIAETPPAIIPLSHFGTGAGLIAISSGGSAAALYSGDSGTLQTLRGLPDNPELVSVFDASHMAGTATRLAVNDDGSMALVNFDDGTASAVWSISSDGSVKPLVSSHPSSMAFLASGHEAIISDGATQEIFIVADLAGSATRIPLALIDGPPSAPIDVAISKDGYRAFVITGNSAAVTILDLDTGSRSIIPCACSPTALHALKGTDLFSLNRVSDPAFHLLQAAEPEPRIVPVPPMLLTPPDPGGPEAQ
jgi:hypothetical protein